MCPTLRNFDCLYACLFAFYLVFLYHFLPFMGAYRVFIVKRYVICTKNELVELDR